MLLLALLCVPAVAVAQGSGQDAEPSGTAPRQTGTVEVLQQDAGYIQISGQRYRVEDGRTRVYAEQRELRLHDLDNGMVVAFTTDGSGVLLRLDILGPADKIRELERN
ncbi:MAG: hypothetical protein WEB57_09460 [Pseudohongiellaceae bacterium]